MGRVLRMSSELSRTAVCCIHACICYYDTISETCRIGITRRPESIVTFRFPLTFRFTEHELMFVDAQLRAVQMMHITGAIATRR